MLAIADERNRLIGQVLNEDRPNEPLRLMIRDGSEFETFEVQRNRIYGDTVRIGTRLFHLVPLN